MFDHIKPWDPRVERRRRRIAAALAFLVLLSGWLYYEFKNYPEEQRAKAFFAALQQRDYEEAYRIWKPTSSYTRKDFMEDWGENGYEGPVNQFHITGSNARGSGVIVRVQVNREKNISLWVEKKDKSLSFPP